VRQEVGNHEPAVAVADDADALGIGHSNLYGLTGVAISVNGWLLSKLQTLKHNSSILIEFDMSEGFCSLTHT